MFVNLCHQSSRHQEGIKVNVKGFYWRKPLRERTGGSWTGKRKGSIWDCLDVKDGLASLLGASGSPSSPVMALPLYPTALSLTGSSPGTAWSWCKGSTRFQTVVSGYLDNYGPCGWSLDSHPHGHHSMTVTKILRFCHYSFSKIYKVVVPGNKMPLSTFVIVINTLFESLNLKNFYVSYILFQIYWRENVLSMTTDFTYLSYPRKFSLY